MTKKSAALINAEFAKTGGITLTERGSSRNFNLFKVNGAVKPFMLRLGLSMPILNLLNAINHAKVYIADTEDKLCARCITEMLSKKCTKGKISKFVQQ
jgi:hypothetical protein